MRPPAEVGGSSLLTAERPETYFCLLTTGATREIGCCVPFRIRPVQDRHRAVEFPHDGTDDGSCTFLDELKGNEWPPASVKVDRLGRVSMALAYTGIGHGTDRAVVLGLTGLTPVTVDPDAVDEVIARVTAEKRVSPPGHPAYRFDPATDLVLDKKTPLTGHANGMAFYAYDVSDRMLLKRIYYSIGGGFVVSDEELQRLRGQGKAAGGKKVPYPFRNAAEMLAMAAKRGLSIAEMKRINEEMHMSAKNSMRARRNLNAMRGCIERGLSQEGIMPGGLKVKRRAALARQASGGGRATGPTRCSPMTGCRSTPWR